MGVVECGGRVDKGEAESESLEIRSQVQTSFHNTTSSKTMYQTKDTRRGFNADNTRKTQETSGFWLIGG